MFKFKDVVKRGGATLDMAGEDIAYNFGYQVSIRDLRVVKARNLRKKDIMAMLKNISNGNLGIWIDKGLAYIDNSITLEHLDDAIQVGKAFNQISIWDWKRNEAVYLK